jgi:hypothetical protein
VYVDLLESHPAAAMAHVRHTAAAACVGSRNERQVFGQLERRIANLLLSHADLAGRRRPDGTIVLPPLSVREIASSLGSIRRSVNKTLASLTQKGPICREDDRLSSWSGTAASAAAPPARATGSRI